MISLNLRGKAVYKQHHPYCTFVVSCCFRKKDCSIVRLQLQSLPTKTDSRLTTGSHTLLLRTFLQPNTRTQQFRRPVGARFYARDTYQLNEPTDASAESQSLCDILFFRCIIIRTLRRRLRGRVKALNKLKGFPRHVSRQCPCCCRTCTQL